MNILFLSNLTGKMWAGPNNSVPAQVLAQSKVDNVMWINLNHISLPQWRREEYIFLNYDDIRRCSIDDLPAPFNKPDFIIFEEIYSLSPFDKMVRSVYKSKLPYSIIPRCSLTALAQKRHRFKKIIGNFLFYKNFIKRSSFIQYLTVQEEIESLKIFAQPSVVIPNGTYIPELTNKVFSKNEIKATYIGRLELIQKGLDLLLAAISKIKDTLRKSNFYMNLYGPNIDNTVENLNEIIKQNKIEDIVSIHSGVFGDDKIKVLETSDIFIMTSRYEGMPMGLIEALSYGIPCIATTGTFLMDEIESSDAGWAAGCDVNDICNALLQMTSEKSLLPSKSSNAKNLAQKYSWDHLAGVLHEYIFNTLKKFDNQDNENQYN